MHDAHYLRSQADLCLAIARQVSDYREAERLRVRAAEYSARADELDDRNQNQNRSPPAPEGRGDDA